MSNSYVTPKFNPYVTPNIIHDIAKAWVSQGYGTYTALRDEDEEEDHYLLFHRNSPNNFNYHIHIGNTTDGRDGFAVKKEKKTHSNYYTGLNNGQYNAIEWADFLWKDTGYSKYKPPLAGGKMRTRKHKKTNKRRKTIKHRRIKK